MSNVLHCRWVSDLGRESIFGVAIGGVEVYGIAVLESLQMRVFQQVSAKSHVPTVNVCLSTAELEKNLSCSRTVICIY